MTYVANNPLLYNACLAGIAAASGGGSNPGPPNAAQTAADTAQTAAALSVAQAVDTAIVADDTITSGGATLAGTTAAIQNATISKAAAMAGIAYAAFDGQSNVGVIPATQIASIASGIKVKYSAVIAAPFSLL